MALGEDWHRLASYVVARRVKLGYRDRKALAATSGVTARTLGKLETGRHVGQVTLADVELALGWGPDSARRILSGGEPAIRDAKEPEPAALGPIGRILSDPDLTEEEKRGAAALIRGMRGIGSVSGS